LEGLAITNIGIFYGHLVYFTVNLVYFVANWYAYFLVIWYIFPHFGMLYQEKSGNPGPLTTTKKSSSRLFCGGVV
jgi:hypothetical protein